jgi:hypothetical protein
MALISSRSRVLLPNSEREREEREKERRRRGGERGSERENTGTRTDVHYTHTFHERNAVFLYLSTHIYLCIYINI